VASTTSRAVAAASARGLPAMVSAMDVIEHRFSSGIYTMARPET
jgi:hypothetical protein